VQARTRTGFLILATIVFLVLPFGLATHAVQASHIGLAQEYAEKKAECIEEMIQYMEEGGDAFQMQVVQECISQTYPLLDDRVTLDCLGWWSSVRSEVDAVRFWSIAESQDNVEAASYFLQMASVLQSIAEQELSQCLSPTAPTS